MGEEKEKNERKEQETSRLDDVRSKKKKRTKGKNKKRLDDVHSKTKKGKKYEEKYDAHVFTTLTRRRETRNVFTTFIRRKRKERTTTKRLYDAPSKESNKKQRIYIDD